MGNGIEPAGLRLAVRVERGYIRFDVQERRPVKDVHILNLKHVSLNTHKPDNRQPDCIRPFRRPRGKYTMRLGIKEGFYFKGISVTPVECVDKNDVRKFFKIAKTGTKFRADFNATPDTPCSAGLDGHTGDIGKRGMNDSNRDVGVRFRIVNGNGHYQLHSWC